MTTTRIKASQITKDWHVIDAEGRPLGRVASEAARLLLGKHKPTFEPHLDDGDFVIVVNASKVVLTGNKAQTKKYHRHSGYPGGLKTRSFEDQLDRFPDKVIEQAVFGMLPKGPLGKKIRQHLKVYGGATHPHTSQVVGNEREREARAAAGSDALEAKLANPKAPRRLHPFAIPTELQPQAEEVTELEVEDVAEIEVAEPVTEPEAPAAVAEESPEATAEDHNDPEAPADTEAGGEPAGKSEED